MPLPNIKAVGFDLDQTLYPDSPEVQQLVRGEIYRFISETLGIPYEAAEKRFEREYAKIQGGGRTLEVLGIEDGSERLRDCIVRADVARILKYDKKLVGMLNRMADDYLLFLITESREEDAKRKLQALGISPELFDFTSYWDTQPLRKHTGTIFPKLFESTGLKAEEHLYCGDRLNDDILPAKKAGMKTVLVGSIHSEADHSIKDIHELEALLYGS